LITIIYNDIGKILFRPGTIRVANLTQCAGKFLPSNTEVARVADRVHRRVMRLVERRGLGPQAGPDEVDSLRLQEPLLAELYSASITGRVATSPREGTHIVRVGDEVDSENAAMKSGRCCASVEGFSVHAGVSIPAHDRVRLEHLQRYSARPPLSIERRSQLPDGRLLYRLKRRWSDGTTHVIYEPMELWSLSWHRSGKGITPFRNLLNMSCARFWTAEYTNNHEEELGTGGQSLPGDRPPGEERRSWQEWPRNRLWPSPGRSV
jgi:hypothetical protein